MKKNWIVQLKKGCRIFLVCTLILGILAGSFGVAAITVKTVKEKVEQNTTDPNEEETGSNFTYESPLNSFDEASNELTLKDDVQVLSDTESDKINSAILNIDSKSDYNGNYFELELDGPRDEFTDKLQHNQIIYLEGGKKSPFNEGRFFKIKNIRSYGDMTYLSLSEPYLEEVFDTVDLALSESLSPENFVSATFMPGVSAQFVGTDVPGLTPVSHTQEDIKPSKLGVATEDEAQPEATGLEIDDIGFSHTFDNGDLVLEFNLEMEFEGDEDEDGESWVQQMKEKEEGDEDEDEDEDDPFEGDFGIRGSFGLHDLNAYAVVDMPTPGKFKELYLGVSGETVTKVTVFGEYTGTAEPDATQKDLLLVELEGLNKKRFPLAVFEFKGTTPLWISNQQFDKQDESILPRLYLMIYADWEGHVSMSLEAGFTYTNAFNHGLRLYENGKLCLKPQEYPFTSAYATDSADKVEWGVWASLEAHTDLTLLGGSALFYVAGINVGELCVTKIGLEAEGKLEIHLPDEKPIDGDIYLRGYLKLMEIRARLIAEGKSFLDDIEVEVDETFTLIEIELFRIGKNQPEKYRPKVPISATSIPEEFRSVITLVCDVSGSMYDTIGTGETKLEAARQAAKTIVDTTASWAANYDDHYGIGAVMFSDYATQVTVPHVDYPYIKNCIDTMDEGGGTCIYSGIDAATEQLKQVKSPNKVMILMTDGQDYNTSEALDSARKAAAEGITIFTIGFGNDVDEDILKQIAEAAGGEYRFSNTDNTMSIMGNFMYAQQSGVADVLAEEEGTIREGETTKPIAIEIEDSNGDLVVYTLWPGSFLDTILIDPNGREVDENYPGAIIDKSTIPTTIIVKNPIPGKWKSKIVGVETSYEDEPYYAIVSFIETDGTKVNEPISDLQTAAAYGIAIGFSTAFISLLLLICLGKKKETD